MNAESDLTEVSQSQVFLAAANGFFCIQIINFFLIQMIVLESCNDLTSVRTYWEMIMKGLLLKIFIINFFQF
jgi:hypothetical protein